MEVTMNQILYQASYQSPLGDLSLVADDQALLGVWFVGQEYFQRGYEGQTFSMEKNQQLLAAIAWLDAYFAGDKPDPAGLNLAAKGSDFQQSVWDLLLTIPPGQTMTYGQLAQALDCKSNQAIGGAVGRNPLSIIVPCHRVLGADGSLTGYAGGLDKKVWLLQHEAALADHP